MPTHHPLEIIHLAHDPRLKISNPVCSSNDKVEIESLEEANKFQSAAIISFRSFKGLKPSRRITNVRGGMRFLNLTAKPIIYFVGIESDTEFFPHILWDIAHSVKIGTRLVFTGDIAPLHYLTRSYYRSSFRIIERSNHRLELVKDAPLLVESESGLDRWSFCIPVGPEDATILNKCVERILELDIKEKEIILCGTPGSNFRYLKDVRIVGEDIVSLPTPIALKKNVAVSSSKYENVCILHDRIYLPLNFLQAVKKFGDMFPITGLQSFYISNKIGFLPFRYSDYCSLVPKNASSKLFIGSSQFRITAGNISQLEKSFDFWVAHPSRYQCDSSYLTGSMYLSKKSLWDQFPQDPELKWCQYEDVDHGIRLSQAGIPSIINTHAFTQSLISRPIVSYLYTFQLINKRAAQRKVSFLEIAWKPKPFIKMTREQAVERMQLFCAKYCPIVFASHNFRPNPDNIQQWISSIFWMVENIQIPYRKAAAENLINDYEKFVEHDQIGSEVKKWLLKNLQARTPNSLKHFTSRLEFHSQNYPNYKTWYCRDFGDYFVPQNMLTPYLIKLALLLSWIKTRHFAVHEDGFVGAIRAFYLTTPFTGKRDK